AIGDFVLTLPAIKLLRDAYPQAQLEILGYKHIIALADRRFYADAVRSIEYGALASFFAKGAELPADLADYFASFDLVVSYLFDPDGIFETNLRRCGVEDILTGSPKVNPDAHAAIQLAQPMLELGFCLRDPAAQLFLNPDDRAFGISALGSNATPIVAVHPGSGSTNKNWPVEKWRMLAQLLLETGAAGSLLLIGGEADEQPLTVLREMLPRDVVTIAENLPLPQLAAMLEGCALFIGHDSGISHIAAAAEIPCLLLFGPTDPAVWAPTNASVRVLRGEAGDVAALDVGRVQKPHATCSRRGTLRADAHRHQNVEERRLDLQYAGTHLVD
nr:glycosyltransferase family 9 protein [Chthoniobacterales bacterium]